MKIRRRVKYDDAIQWTGQAIDDLRIMSPRILFSQNHDLFYVSGLKPNAWISVEPNEKGIYKEYPFWMYEIKIDYEATRAATPDDPLVKLYMDFMNIYELEKPRAFLEIESQPRFNVQLGDYIITYANGTKDVLTPEQFAEFYK